MPVAERREKELEAKWTELAKEATRKTTMQKPLALSAKATAETKLIREAGRNT